MSINEDNTQENLDEIDNETPKSSIAHTNDSTAINKQQKLEAPKSKRFKIRHPFSIFKPKTILSNIKNKQPAPIVLYILLLSVISLLAIPTTRYTILGTAIKKPFTITVIDSETNKPVSEVAVMIDGKTIKTNKEGAANFSALKVGKHVAEIMKPNYTSTKSDVFVSLLQQKSIPTVELQATGRQVNVQVLSYITKKPVSNVFIRFDDFEARTDEQGIASLVAPAGKDAIEAQVSVDGYNEKTIIVKVSEEQEAIPENIFTITPTGSIYFLSKLTGKIDVVSSNLDGTNRKVILEASGYETETGTVLVASRDWKHIAVRSIRTPDGKETVSYIDTSTNTIKVADEGDATFQIIGWYEDRLIYVVNRNVTEETEKYKLKSYNPVDGKIALLDITEFKSLGYSCDSYGYCGDKYYEETITKVAIVDGGILYAKEQYGGPGPTSKIYKIKADGKDKTEVASIEEGNYIQQFVAWDPNEIYYNYYENTSNSYKYFELAFNDSEPKEITDPIEKIAFDTGVYNAYLLSPNSEKSFWSESRDGKSVFFTGGKSGEDENELIRLSEYAAYGWYTNEYLLLTKNSSELFIMPVDGGEPVKITDYHKPENGYRPYGYGYGG